MPLMSPPFVGSVTFRAGIYSFLFIYSVGLIDIIIWFGTFDFDVLAVRFTTNVFMAEERVGLIFMTMNYISLS